MPKLFLYGIGQEESDMLVDCHKLKLAREKAGVTRAELARHIEYSVEGIRKMEEAPSRKHGAKSHVSVKEGVLKKVMAKLATTKKDLI